MSDLPRTACFDCGRTHPPDRKRCDCGQPVWFDPKPGVEGLRDDALAPDPTLHGIWRYADALPAPAPVDPRADLGAATGATPLIRAPGLGTAIGSGGDPVASDGATPGTDADRGPTVWVKDETANPTGTFKDRGTAVAIHGIDRRRGADDAPEATPSRIGTVSHGNMAISTAAFAAAAGTGAVVLVPADVSEGRLAAIARYDPAILRVEGDYGRLYHETLALDAPGIDFVNSDTPLRVAGQKTVAYELCAQLPREPSDDAVAAPDAVVLPVSSGGHASAAWKGLRELRSADLIDDLPRIYLVQAAACAPIARAFEENRSVEPVDPGETVAYSIANPDPPSGDRALAAVRDTGGAVLAVEETAIGGAVEEFARRTGLTVEPGSAVALAGLRDLVEEGAIGADEEAVLIATGTGFREPGRADVDAPVVALADLGERFGGGDAAGE